MAIQATQSRHPWRAVFRTIVAVSLVLAPFMPEIVDTLGAGSVPWVMAFVGAIGAVTRVLAMPAVNELLRRYGVFSWLAAEPKPSPTVRTSNPSALRQPDRRHNL